MDENQVVDAFVTSMDSAEAPETAAANPETEAAQVEGVDAPQPETPEVQAEQQEEAETIEIDPEAPLFEQEVEEDGKKVAQKLSLKELQQGYLRERDYRRKTQDLARQREELPKLVAKQAQELSESYGKRLSELQSFVQKFVAENLNLDLNKLEAEGDMLGYMRASNQLRRLQELQQSIQQEQETEAKKRKEEEQKSYKAKLSETLEILTKDIPDFGETTVKRLYDTGKERGFSMEEMNTWTDHRLFKMLHDLSEKKAAETKRPQVEKKVAVVTKVLKPGQPARSRSAIDEAKARFRKSGKPEDALAIFESFV